jgi:membrane fusion protein (multidrug efflux system)
MPETTTIEQKNLSQQRGSEEQNTQLDNEAELTEEGQKRSKGQSLLIGIVVLLVLAVGATLWLLHSHTYEDTDDAQVDGHIDPISARISGTVSAVHVEENARVMAGQPLVDLDMRPQAVTVEQTRAQYDQAIAQFDAQRPNVPITVNTNRADISSDQAALDQALAAVEGAKHDRDQAASKLTDAQAQNTRDQSEYQRYKQLFEKGEASRQDLEKYTAALESSDANVAGAKSALASAVNTVDQRQSQAVAKQSKRDQDLQNAPHQLKMQLANLATQQAAVASAKAQLEQSHLNLSFTKIVAPVDGIVTQRSAEVGSHVNEGTQLMMLVETRDIWVTANFKETQLRKMHAGQSARIRVDALGREFDGYVDSMPAITGARSSILPPENATGNYVKVVQRLPVRLRFKANQDGLDELRPGMSVESTVYLR